MKCCICFLLLILAQGFIWAEEIHYQDAKIDLTGTVNLKMVFDGGLRPTRTPGLETACCQVENVNAKIIFPGNRAVSVLVERGDFSVDAEGNLTSINLYGPYRSLDESIDHAEAVSRMLSLDPDGLENLRSNPGSWEDPAPRGWGKEFDTQEYRTRFILRRQARYKEIGADFNFTYRWRYPAQFLKMRTTPIQPPSGYENVSMAPPPWHPIGHRFPMFSFEEAQALVDIVAFVIVAIVIALTAVIIVALWRSFRPNK